MNNDFTVIRPLHTRLRDYFFEALSPTARGVILALVSTALFTITGVIVRLLSERIDVFQILFFRQLVFITLLTPAMYGAMDKLLKPQLIRLHLFRIAGAFAALYLGFVCISNIPLADATALGFMQVLFVALISQVFLSESVGKGRMFTIVAGFAGVMLVVRPEFANPSSIYILAGLGGALGAAVAVVCVRRMAQTESRVVMLAYQAVFVGLIALIPSISLWQWPTVYELLLLTAVGVISSVAQWVGVTAYREGEANIVANVEYVKMIYSILLGYWLFAEVPDLLAVIGAAIIIASALIPFALGLLKRKSQS
ncbi:DMT family transporter [Spongorhabdus nitratireducens]